MIDEEQKTRLITSGFWDYSHQYSTDGEISGFISNRIGRHQIWLKEGDREQTLQIEALKALDITNFQWSFDSNKRPLYQLAITTYPMIKQS